MSENRLIDPKLLLDFIISDAVNNDESVDFAEHIRWLQNRTAAYYKKQLHEEFVYTNPKFQELYDTYSFVEEFKQKGNGLLATTYDIVKDDLEHKISQHFDLILNTFSDETQHLYFDIQSTVMKTNLLHLTLVMMHRAIFNSHLSHPSFSKVDEAVDKAKETLQSIFEVIKPNNAKFSTN